LELRDKISLENTVINLSDGEKQAIAIGRAVYFKVKLVIMNEPTAAMSLKETKNILELMVSLKKAGSAVIFINHNIHHVFSVTDRLIVLSCDKKSCRLKNKRNNTGEEVLTMIMND